MVQAKLAAADLLFLVTISGETLLHLAVLEDNLEVCRAANILTLSHQACAHSDLTRCW